MAVYIIAQLNFVDKPRYNRCQTAIKVAFLRHLPHADALALLIRRLTAPGPTPTRAMPLAPNHHPQRASASSRHSGVNPAAAACQPRSGFTTSDYAE